MTIQQEYFMINELFTDGLFVKTLMHIGAGLACGLCISGSYAFSNREKSFSRSFFVTVFTLPALVAVIIPLIGTDIARAISLGGVFTLVRFRSLPGNSKDLLYVFFTMAAGLAIGVEQYAAAIVISVVISAVLVLLMRLLESGGDSDIQILKVTVPENADYRSAFAELFDSCLASWKTVNVKLTNMGTLFTVTYRIRFKKGVDEKQFLDDLRIRNGNLNIILADSSELSAEQL